MNAIITLIRFPIGIVGILIVSCFYFLLFPFELIVALLALPFSALLMKREDYRVSWLGSFPNTLKKLLRVISGILNWIGRD